MDTPAPGVARNAVDERFFHEWVAFGLLELAVYLTRHAQQLGDRWRLRSPFLEHFSQAFSRSFMRVGLPSAVPEF